MVGQGPEAKDAAQYFDSSFRVVQVFLNFGINGCWISSWGYQYWIGWTTFWSMLGFESLLISPIIKEKI